MRLTSHPRLFVVSCAFFVACARWEAQSDAVGTLRFALTDGGQSADGGSDAGYVGHLLTAERALRRMQLAVLNRPPTDAERARLAAASTIAQKETVLGDILTDDLGSTEFYDAMMEYGRDVLRLGNFNAGVGGGDTYFPASLAVTLEPCPAGTRHAGALGHFNGFRDGGGGYLTLGDSPTICDSATAPVTNTVPWWDPQTTVTVIGRAGTGNRVNGSQDCGTVHVSGRDIEFRDDVNQPLCSCGPNLVWCDRALEGTNSMVYHWNSFKADSLRRQLFEEPARLFAHVAWQDRPLSDLVVGNYTVAPLHLRFNYLRAGRHNTANTSLDDRPWWDRTRWAGPTDPHALGPADPMGWTEFVPETVNPHLLSLTPNNAVASGQAALARTYRFDPRVDPGEARGIPSAGVLTTLNALASFGRERVRAARWMETFACRVYTPPDPSIVFNDYHRDPATEGVCQHCHVSIDPAAIFFKRFGYDLRFGLPVWGGVGAWKLTPNNRDAIFTRWRQAYEPDTVMTPVTAAQASTRPDSVFIDFLPAGSTFLGATSDGTAGPLGFGKLLIASGEFDRCFVRNAYERFVGVTLDPAEDQALIQELARAFQANDRKLRPFIAHLVGRPEFRRGW